MKVNPEKLSLLKEPFGVLIKDNLVNKAFVTEMLGNAPKIVTVGDTTTEKLIGYGIIPDISVIDGKEKRVIKTTKLDYDVDKVIKLSNNPGELDDNIIAEVRKLFFQNQGVGNNISEGNKNKLKVTNSVEGAKRFEEKEIEKEKEKEVEKEASKTAETTLISSKMGVKKTGPNDLPVSQTDNFSSDIEYQRHNEFANTLSEKVQIVIDGEEDIVALPFLILAPVGWVVCYGQPNEGLVIVKITEESKKRAESIFNKVFI